MSTYRKRRYSSGSYRRKSGVGKVFIWCLVIFLLISMVPVLFSLGGPSPDREPTKPTDPSMSGPSYAEFMEDYVLVASDDFSYPDITLVTISSVAQGDNSIFRETDDAGNSCIKFGNYSGSSGTYINLKHGQGAQQKIVLEMDFCWNDPGLDIEFLSGSENKMLMWICNGEFHFQSPDGEKVVVFDSGKWYKLTYVLNLENRTYSIYADEMLLFSDLTLRSDVTELTRIRMQIHNQSNAGGADGDFMIDNLKWYLPCETVIPDSTDPTV